MFKKIEGVRMKINPEVLITEVATEIHEERRKLDPKARPDLEDSILTRLADRGVSSTDAHDFLPKVKKLLADLYFANPDNYSLEKKLESRVPELDLDDLRLPAKSSRSKGSTTTNSEDTSLDASGDPLTYGEFTTDSGITGEDLAHLDELRQDTKI